MIEKKEIKVFGKGFGEQPFFRKVFPDKCAQSPQTSYFGRFTLDLVVFLTVALTLGEDGVRDC